MANNAADYRVEIKRLLELAQKLSAQRQDRIREAVRERHALTKH